jgi:hypothetical protein
MNGNNRFRIGLVLIEDGRKEVLESNAYGQNVLDAFARARKCLNAMQKSYTDKVKSEKKIILLDGHITY